MVCICPNREEIQIKKNVMDYIAIVKKREKMPKPQNQEGGQFPPITKKPSPSRFRIKLLI